MKKHHVQLDFLSGSRRLQMTESINLTIAGLATYGERFKHWAAAWAAAWDAAWDAALAAIADRVRATWPEPPGGGA